MKTYNISNKEDALEKTKQFDMALIVPSKAEKKYLKQTAYFELDYKYYFDIFFITHYSFVLIDNKTIKRLMMEFKKYLAQFIGIFLK